ncbi:MAG TPA: nucleotidyltransferase domain-containing protein [Chloroflexota bacterium]|nr:nucleotidyltransferase domain-containing protein [Chloroflexota bacterium]HUM70833.1 nucleotidyltransferase domain-containing protein [Chloroflexota bacterium]
MTSREYHAQREAERWQQRETLRLEMLSRVRQAIGQLAPGFPTIQAVYLFGSVVQPGRFTSHSDIDVAVDSERVGDWLAAESVFWRQLEEAVRWMVDLRPYAHPITQTIADYGECIYARESDYRSH